ncbi:hypothetical protein BD769DRAFT_1508391 [Suillus cothurnatus]|nr:hypothetical protein BD769DRAFT_1508391 [Suillus cothurnatus]
MAMQFHNSYSSNGVSNRSASEPGHSLNETFQCMWNCPGGVHCNDLIRGFELSAHLRETHGIHGSDKSRLWCLWNSCHKEVNKESLVRHVEEIHMRIEHMCGCGASFSRKDTLNRHRKSCSGQP